MRFVVIGIVTKEHYGNISIIKDLGTFDEDPWDYRGIDVFGRGNRESGAY